MMHQTDRRADGADTAAIFQPFHIGKLRLKNQILRSSISVRIDNYDGSGTRARVNFEERFARISAASTFSASPKAEALCCRSAHRSAVINEIADELPHATPDAGVS